MKIVLASALFPPDIAEPARYAKELARRLGEKHEVTLVIYGYLPEKVPRVRFACVNKRRPLLWRLVHYTYTLFNAVRGADILYAENGSSIELPVVLLALLKRIPIVMHFGDVRAHAHAEQSIVRRGIERLAMSLARNVLKDNPTPRPEILPLEAYPEDALAQYESSWNAHMKVVEGALMNAK